MGFGSLVLGALAILLYGFVLLGLPVLWVSRRRRGEAITSRQIALTEARDAAVGPIITPVVEKPFRRPWQVRMALPILSAETQGRILAITREVLSSPAYTTAPYQLILTPAPVRASEPKAPGTNRPMHTGRPKAVAA